MRISIVLFILAIFAGGPAQGQVTSDVPPQPKPPSRGFVFSDMEIAPPQLTISARSVGVFYVINRSASPRDFRIIAAALGDDERLRHHDAGEWLRFGPRQFSLPPDASQVVRVAVRRLERPDGAESLPLRARLQISLLPLAIEPPKERQPTERTFGMRILGTYAVSIPVDITL